MEAASNGSNTKWYAYPELGSYFRLDGSQLLQSPMLMDGTRGSNAEIAEVDFSRGVDDADENRLREIMKELAEKE